MAGKMYLALVALAGAVTALAPASSRAADDVSLRYSALVAPASSSVLHGWQASVEPIKDATGSFVVDAGGYYAGGASIHVLMAGPRATKRLSHDATVFLQLMVGLAALTYEGNIGVVGVLQPGVGANLRTSSALGFRIQVEWPLVAFNLPPSEILATDELPRISAGIVWRPERRARRGP